MKVLEQLAEFIEKHGDSRFSEDRGIENDTTPVRERCGWYQRGYAGEGRVYWFNSAGLREALHGHDFERGLDVLQAAGVLPTQRGAKGERAKPKKIRGELMRLYPIHRDKLP